MKRVLVSIILALVFTSESWATTGTAGSPSTIYHSVKSNAPISVTWTVTGGAGIHSSTVGTFIDPTSNSIIGTDNITTTLNISCVVVGTGTSCTSAPETFTIPATILATALSDGLSTIHYSRGFSDGVVSTGIVRINLLNTSLSISRESLRFSDNATTKLVKSNARVSATAELRYTGSGLLNAFWEVATPTGTSGNIIFTRLRNVNRYLGAGGRVILQSPPLPTFTTGQYIVRLQILRTSSNPRGVEFTSSLPDGLPILRYSVMTAAGDSRAHTSPPIKTSSPIDNAFLKTDTLFSWQAIKGAEAYQLELYLLNSHQRPDLEMKGSYIDDSSLENIKPATGLLIPANKTSLSLSALARDTLRSRQIYYWRIIAIGSKGQILTTSQLKKIRTP